VFAGAAANGAPSDPRSLRQNSPATRAMRLTRTAPQPVAPEEPATGVWPTGPAGYHDGYTGAYDAQESGPSGFGPGDGRNDTDLRDRIRDTAAFERPSDGFADLDDDRPPLESGNRGNRGRRGGGHRAGSRRNDGGDDYRRPGRRRWPIVTGALVLLVLLVAGGGYGFWRYNQSQYYIGITPDGHVAIFRGTNENLAGISLSTLLSTSILKANMLTSNDQAALAQTISESSWNDSEQRIYQLQVEAKKCQTTYQALATWQTQYMSYQNYLRAKVQAAAAKTRTKPPAVVANPGLMPSPLPTANECAPSTVFGIETAALPTPQEGAAAATPSGPTAPPVSPSATASGTAAPHTSVPATSTAQAAG